MISPERDPVLKRSRRECIRRTKQMNVVRHDHVATDTPEVRCLPCGDESSRRLLVCEQRLSPVSTYREEDNDRSEANFDGRKMGRFLSLRAGCILEKRFGGGKLRRGRLAPGVAELRPPLVSGFIRLFCFACFQHSDSLLDVRQSNRKRETFAFVTLDREFAAMFTHNAAHN